MPMLRFQLNCLLAAAWAAVICMCLPACQQDGGQASIEGDTLLLPADSQYLAFQRAVPKEVPFQRFDGRYPGAWPKGVRFPPEVYLRDSPKMEFETAPSGDISGKVFGVAKMSSAKLLEMLHRQFVADGWQMNEITATAATGVDGAEYPRELVLSGSYKRTKFDRRSSHVEIKSPEFRRMGGFAVFQIKFEYKGSE